jgi:type II secretory pathway component PulJ
MTILEVVLAVAILSMISVALFQFVRSTLKAIALSSEDVNNRLAVERLVDLVQEELYALPARGQSTLLGKAVKLSGRDVDTLEWRSKGGPGLMTTAAKGEYQVRLRIKPIARDSSHYEIGVEREQVIEETDGGLVAAAGTAKPDWIPLIPDAKSMRVRFFDPRLNTEVDQWNDPAARPSYVRLSIAREDDEVPLEAVVGIPSAIATQQQ